MLPSRVMQEASTFDLVIMDMSMTYERHVNASQDSRYIPDVSQEDLMKIKEQV